MGSNGFKLFPKIGNFKVSFNKDVTQEAEQAWYQNLNDVKL